MGRLKVDASLREFVKFSRKEFDLRFQIFDQKGRELRLEYITNGKASTISQEHLDVIIKYWMVLANESPIKYLFLIDELSNVFDKNSVWFNTLVEHLDYTEIKRTLNNLNKLKVISDVEITIGETKIEALRLN